MTGIYHVGTQTYEDLFETEPYGPEYADFAARDASLHKAVFNALKLCEIVSGDVPEEVNDEELDEDEMPNNDSLETSETKIVSWGYDDPISTIYKDGEAVAAYYFSFRGNYQGALKLRFSGKQFRTSDVTEPDGLWQEVEETFVVDTFWR